MFLFSKAGDRRQHGIISIEARLSIASPVNTLLSWQSIITTFRESCICVVDRRIIGKTVDENRYSVAHAIISAALSWHFMQACARHERAGRASALFIECWSTTRHRRKPRREGETPRRSERGSRRGQCASLDWLRHRHDALASARRLKAPPNRRRHIWRRAGGQRTIAAIYSHARQCFANRWRSRDDRRHFWRGDLRETPAQRCSSSLI